MRSRFDEQLDALHQEMIAMGGLCEKAIALSAKALLEGNRSLTLDVPRLSAQIDQHERDIESLCFKLLMRQQPVARDLRVISAALKMVTDMERILQRISRRNRPVSVCPINSPNSPFRRFCPVLPLLAGCRVLSSHPVAWSQATVSCSSAETEPALHP